MKKNVKKVWGVRYTLGARYLLKNTVISNFQVSTYMVLKLGCFGQ
jgi:hypothetical protein